MFDIVNFELAQIFFLILSSEEMSRDLSYFDVAKLSPSTISSTHTGERSEEKSTKAQRAETSRVLKLCFAGP